MGEQRALSTKPQVTLSPKPRTKTAFVHLPPELHLAIFSHLPDDEDLATHLDYGTVCRAFRRANIAGSPKVRDSNSCGYFRSLFRRPEALPFSVRPVFDATWPKLQTLDLADAWTNVAGDKQAYFVRLLAEHRVTLQNLILHGCAGCQTLPNALELAGDLDLSGSGVAELPKTLRVGGRLNVRDTEVATLPHGLFVGGDLILYDSLVTRLPADTSIGGNLDLEDSLVTHLTNGLSVGGTLRLTGSEIEQLPVDLTVGKHLFFAGEPRADATGAAESRRQPRGFPDAAHVPSCGPQGRWRPRPL